LLVEYAEVVDQPRASHLGPRRSTLRSSDGPAARTQLVAGLKAKLGSTASDVAYEIGDVEANDFDRVRGNSSGTVSPRSARRAGGTSWRPRRQASTPRSPPQRNPVGTSAVP
jgi:hypothetical protein